MSKKSSFYDTVMSDRPTLVDFYATWCGPCKMMNPTLSEVAKSVKGKAKVIKIDIDKNQKLANRLSVKSVPTIMIYQKGKIVWRKSGVHSKHQLEQALQKFY